MPATTDSPLSRLATTLPGASRVFQRHGLDFCCGGKRSLEAACAAADLDAGAVLAEIDREGRDAEPLEAWTTLAPPELTRRIVDTYHVAHRAELPQLVEMAKKVESVHAERAGCPGGLAAHLEGMRASLLLHMEKEEQILFPMIQAGRFEMAGGPIHVMELEHEDAARDLRRTRELTGGLVPPAEACTTWRALYLRLETFERELMEHAGIENDVLFTRVLAGR